MKRAAPHLSLYVKFNCGGQPLSLTWTCKANTSLLPTPQRSLISHATRPDLVHCTSAESGPAQKPQNK